MKINKKYTVGLACLLVSATAYAFPWDIDLVDSPAFKGYKWRMMTPASDSISQEQSSPFLRVEYTKDVTKYGLLIIAPDPKGAPTMVRKPSADHVQQLVGNADIYAQSKQDAIAYYAGNKYRATSDTRDPMLKAGETMAKTYCQACHMVEPGAGPSPVTWSKEIMNDRGDDVQRWGAAASIMLAGPDSKISNDPKYTNDDNALYDVIRNGWSSMPAYGHAMYDHEIWATIKYLRSVSK